MSTTSVFSRAIEHDSSKRPRTLTCHLLFAGCTGEGHHLDELHRQRASLVQVQRPHQPLGGFRRAAGNHYCVRYKGAMDRRYRFLTFTAACRHAYHRVRYRKRQTASADGFGGATGLDILPWLRGEGSLRCHFSSSAPRSTTADTSPKRQGRHQTYPASSLPFCIGFCLAARSSRLRRRTRLGTGR